MQKKKRKERKTDIIYYRPIHSFGIDREAFSNSKSGLFPETNVD
jgi:hypothetical protein